MKIRNGWWSTERLALLGILALAAALRLWRLGEHGYGNLYYAAGVRSMMTGWRNFFFGAFDPAGFVSVDKPPVAFWLQAASAWLFGFSGWSLMLPQALGGVAAVALLYHLVRRPWGAGAGLLAALVLAITPIAVAVDRVNSTDSLLVVVLVVAAWPLLWAVETGRLGPLLLAMTLVGVGFNVKMLAAYVVLPAFVLVYLLTAPLVWRTRAARLAVAGGVLAIVSLSWSVAVDLTPASARPYVGDSQNNTELDLILGYNGVARLIAGTRWAMGTRRGVGGGRPGVAPPAGAAPSTPSADGAAADRAPGAGVGAATVPMTGVGSVGGVGGAGVFPGGRGRFGGGAPGPLRLAGRALAGDVTWLLPLAALGILAVVLERVRRPLGDPRRQAVLFWGLWLASGAIVFSLAQGMFRPYYVVLLAPALAALVGIGVTALWERYGEPGWTGGLLPVAVLATAAWQAYVLSEYRDWGPALTAVAVGGGVVAALGLILARLRVTGTPPSSLPLGPKTALAAGLVALLVSPAAWAATPALLGGASGVPAVGPDLLTRGRGGAGFGAANVGRLVDFLRVHRHGERYFLATANALLASPVIVETGEPVMAIGGWGGGDPILTVDRFAALVAEGQVRFVLVPGPAGRDGGPPPRLGGAAGGPADALAGGRNAELLRWVTEHGRRVDPALWRPEPTLAGPDASLSRPLPPGGRWAGGPAGAANAANGGGWWGRRGGLGRAQQLYDCRPGAVDAVAAEGES
jgi:4-amino-4-deoxy-L-arabinose transferase-like glycosyltransferase